MYVNQGMKGSRCGLALGNKGTLDIVKYFALQHYWHLIYFSCFLSTNVAKSVALNGFNVFIPVRRTANGMHPGQQNLNLLS